MYFMEEQATHPDTIVRTAILDLERGNCVDRALAALCPILDADHDPPQAPVEVLGEPLPSRSQKGSPFLAARRPQ